MTQRKHMHSMIEFAMYPDSLVFVNMGTIGGTDFFILVEVPLWDDDREYQVRNDMTLEEATADRQQTLAAFAEAEEAAATLAQY